MNKKEEENGRVLDLLLEEAIRAREEILSHMENNSSKLFTLSNISLVLVGAYLTSILIVSTDNETVIIPLLFALGLSIGGFIIGLIGMFPRYYTMIKPSELYGLKEKQRNYVTDTLLQMYLLQENELLLKASQKPFLIKIKVIFMMGSIIEFLIMLAAFVFVVDRTNAAFILLTASSLVIFAVICLIAVQTRNHRRMETDLRKQLE